MYLHIHLVVGSESGDLQIIEINMILVDSLCRTGHELSAKPALGIKIRQHETLGIMAYRQRNVGKTLIATG